MNEDILDGWYEKVITKADEYLNKSEEYEIGSNNFYKYRCYADGMYMVCIWL